MAVTKIKPIRGTVNKALAYILDPAKTDDQLYDERAKLKKEARLIDTMKANVDDFLSPSMAKEQEKSRSGELE